jgi:transcription-repair coupling factor (superfamily II helicase)
MTEAPSGGSPSEAERIVFAPAVTPMPAVAGSTTPLARDRARRAERDRRRSIGLLRGALADDRDPTASVLAPRSSASGRADPRAVSGVAAALRPPRRGERSGGRCAFRPRRSRARRRAPKEAADLNAALASGEEVFVASPAGGAEKLKRLAIEYGFHVLVGATAAAPVVSSRGDLRGFRCASAARVYAEEEIFGEERRSPRRGRRPTEAFLSDLRDLKLGDAVVHATTGSAASGLKRVPVEGEEREFMEIEYAEEKTLLLPVERLRPRPEVLGRRGRRARARPPRRRGMGEAQGLGPQGDARHDRPAPEALRARAASPRGSRSRSDSPWQKEFEDAFEYVETPDQAQAIADVKRDMQSAKPMDRLLCGDVGYGKTEVAMRAASRPCSTASRSRCSRRRRSSRTSTSGPSRALRGVPVTIDLLSRFRSRNEQKESSRRSRTARSTSSIATHRMLAQGPGVPGPRPPDRRRGAAVRRRAEGAAQGVEGLDRRALDVGDADPALAPPLALGPARPVDHRDAAADRSRSRRRSCRQGRGDPRGDRLRARDAAARCSSSTTASSRSAREAELEELLPDVRDHVAPRADARGELEKAMRSSSRATADVLLATAIVENGLDIPSANTILIDRADTFGLAQLYQLRGASAAATSPHTRTCSSRDRGALGRRAAAARRRSRSSATSARVPDRGEGPRDPRFRQPARRRAVRPHRRGRLRDVPVPARGDDPRARGRSSPERAVTMSLGIDLAIPHDYVDDESWRMMIYKKVARARDDRALEETRQEIADRFGEPPERCGG